MKESGASLEEKHDIADEADSDDDDGSVFYECLSTPISDAVVDGCSSVPAVNACSTVPSVDEKLVSTPIVDATETERQAEVFSTMIDTVKKLSEFFPTY